MHEREELACMAINLDHSIKLTKPAACASIETS